MPKKIPVVYVWKDGPMFLVQDPMGEISVHAWSGVAVVLLTHIRTIRDVRIKYEKPQGEK